MPIEIRELHIKVSVTSPEAEQTITGSVPESRRGNDPGGVNREEIVAQCVEKVMDLIKNKTER